MNKYFILLIVGAVIIAGGLGYRLFLLPQTSAPVVSGAVREITIIAKRNEWRFAPEDINVERGDRVKLTVINEDNYDHGLAIDAFGISQRMPANSTIHLEFVATQAGDFPFYCSVPCGGGVVNGEKRDHFSMVGRLHVKDLVKITP
ncbi:MAG: cupredoxin domain-containing protein [Candidatus Vogelbacteria bacterium]|nr:cupredoxin domain-containing protein [Candidatus Vogelbacteria bacterium]